MSRRAVLLPDPEGPTSTMNSRSSTLMLRSRSTSVEPKDLRIPLSSTVAMPAPPSRLHVGPSGPGGSGRWLHGRSPAAGTDTGDLPRGREGPTGAAPRSGLSIGQGPLMGETSPTPESLGCPSVGLNVPRPIHLPGDAWR